MNCLIVGRGKTGISAENYCKRNNINYTFWDDKTNTKADIANKLENINFLIISPSFTKEHPLLIIASDKKIPCYTDIDIFVQNNPNKKIIGITGTNGKSTTTALIHHLFNQKDLTTYMGSNIGIPVLDLKNDGDFYVLELSSYQLELSHPINLEIGILLNITPDHLEWHKTLENYIRAKKKIFEKCKHIILGIDDPITKKIYEELKAEGKNVITVSTTQKADFYFKNNTLMHDNEEIFNIENLLLKGVHNFQNILVSIATAKLCGIKTNDIIKKLQTFKGLEHRQELVEKIDDITFINDSKATNAEATKHSLNAYKDYEIHWILGGLSKEEGIDPLTTYFNNIKHAYLIGDSTNAFSKILSKNNVQHKKSENLKNALQHAYKNALRSDAHKQKVILLSPACASFDQFKNFEERGNAFKKVVHDILQQTS